MELTIRPAAEQDYPPLLVVLNHALEYKSHREDHSWGTERFTEEELKRYAQTYDLYVAEQNGELIGTFSLGWDDEDHKWGDQPHADAAYLHRLAISEDKHGWKLGEKILEQAERLARERNRHFLRLDCNADSARLCSYYENLGFERMGTVPTDTGNYVGALYQRPL